jgi:hypothetical protein
MTDEEIYCSLCHTTIGRLQKRVRLSRPTPIGDGRAKQKNYFWHSRFKGDCFDKAREAAQKRVERKEPKLTTESMTEFEKFLATREAKGAIQ